MSNRSREGSVRRSASSQVEKSMARIPAFDFTKGVLVLLMVLYHWLNYFVSTDGSFYKYLRFLTPSFIFITGFLVSHIYLIKYAITDHRLPKRLLQRGLKLLAIFLTLNAALVLFASSPTGGSGATWGREQLLATFLTGNTATGRVAAFSILVPISYLLVLCSGLLMVARIHPNVFRTGALLFLLTILLLALFGQKSAYLELVTIGLLGVCAGHISPERTKEIVSRPIALTVMYLAYVAAITKWNEIYPLQIVGVCLTLALLYLAGSSEVRPQWIWDAILLLGKYSLFGYICHIVILKILQKVLTVFKPGGGVLVASLSVAVVLTVVSVALLDRARAKVPIVNKAYGAAFA